MASHKSLMAADVARDYLENVSASALGKTCLTQMGLAMVAENPLGGDDEATVDIAMKLSLQVYRQFKPRSKRGFTWGDDTGNDNVGGGGNGAGVGEAQGKGKRSRKS